MQSQLSNLNFSKGLPGDTWSSLQCELESAIDRETARQQMLQECPQLIEKVLEAGFYAFAVLLKSKDFYWHSKALFFSGLAEEAVQAIQAQAENTPAVQLSRLLMMRIQGDSKKAVIENRSSIENLLTTLPIHLSIEGLLQWGSILFNAGEFESALKYYSRAAEMAEQRREQGKQAIANYNLAATLIELGRTAQAKTWLWSAKNLLQTYHLDSLHKTLQLLELQMLLSEHFFAEATQRCQQLLAQANLSPVQNVRILQALAEAQMEQGHVFDSQISLSQAKKLMAQNKFHQFEKDQLLLELNLFSLVYTKGSSLTKFEALKPTTEYKIALARIALKQNEMTKVLRTTSELQKLAIAVTTFEDLMVLTSNQLEIPSPRARVLENQIYKVCLSRQWAGLRYLDSYLTGLPALNLWQSTLKELVKGILSYLAGDAAAAEKYWALGQDKANFAGLERLQSFMMFLLKQICLKTTDPVKEFSVNGAELAFFESLVEKIAGGNGYTRESVGGTASQPHLIFDEVKNEIVFNGQVYLMSEQPLSTRILQLLLGQTAGASKEELIQSVWGLEYHPLHHDPMIYSAIRRLRDIVPVEMNDGKYTLPKNIRWTQVSSKKESTLVLSEPQRKALVLLESNHVISRKDIVNSLNVSERTAVRLLGSLVQLRLLQSEGAGRGVVYRRMHEVMS